MPEFQDFLKNKYAYVAIGEFKPGRFEEAKQLYEKAIANYSEGFRGSFLLQEPGTDKGIAIILWDEVDDMDANQSEVTRTIMQQMAPLFVKPPTTSLCEVRSEIRANEMK